MEFFRESGELGSDLRQGDLISLSGDLKGTLREVHPHFAADRYAGFVVLTQSCDLVRRKGIAKTPYVTIGAVRRTAECIDRSVMRFVEPNVPGLVVRGSRKRELRQFIERIVNNEEPEYFYFPLQRNPFRESLVAFHRVSIALRASEHYPSLLNSRVGGLVEAQEHKMGYLLGRCYGRIGTQNLVDILDKKEFRKVVDRYLKPISERLMWVPEDLMEGFHEGFHQFCEARNVDEDARNEDHLLEFVKELEDEKKRKREARIADLFSVLDRELRKEVEDHGQLETALIKLRKGGHLDGFLKFK